MKPGTELEQDVMIQVHQVSCGIQQQMSSKPHESAPRGSIYIYIYVFGSIVILLSTWYSRSLPILYTSIRYKIPPPVYDDDLLRSEFGQRVGCDSREGQTNRHNDARLIKAAFIARIVKHFTDA